MLRLGERTGCIIMQYIFNLEYSEESLVNRKFCYILAKTTFCVK